MLIFKRSAIGRNAGGNVVNPSLAPPLKPPSKGHAHAAVDLSGPRDLLRLCTFVTLGAVGSSVVIGACRGGLDNILVALLIAGAISLISWSITLLAVVLILIPEILRLTYRRLAGGSPHRPGSLGGLADEWLDGPA
jgi:hypothetical protein